MRILVIRLSSLGDVILSTAFLQNLPLGIEVDWVVSREFAFVLEGHPRIRKLWVYDKRSGLRGWFRLCREIHSGAYAARVDLHRTLRSRLAFVFFRIRDLYKSGTLPTQISISKQRLRNLALLLLKGACPRSVLPEPYWKRFAAIASRFSGSVQERLNPPDYTAFLPTPDQEREVLRRYALEPKQYLAVMPASRWTSKEWGVEGYVQVLSGFYRTRRWTPLVLGRNSDRPCVELVRQLKEAGIPVSQALEEPEFRNTAVLLKHAVSYLGSDTGLSHLAEAVGTPSRVIFGPTRPELGFGPWRADSRSISIPLSCAPCSKDGRHCFRLTDPYRCMRGISPGQVEEVFE
jgi:ADP-heptose:LPS heptosyltransferase